ncbi:MAG: SoxR reducing system RseC family protein [Prevotella sp.]|nr:SoxR reducing system RseC family protein [Prevotella sp.]
MSQKISHAGVIERIEGNSVRVRIVQTTACASCQIAGHCNASDQKVKHVDVKDVAETSALHVGQPVVVSASQAAANRALLLGFGLPFVLMVVVLMVVLSLKKDEAMAALAAVGVLLPYYFGLWLCRDRIGRKISFYLEQ